VGGTVGEFQGDAFQKSGSREMKSGMPGSATSRGAGVSLLPHGHSAQAARAEGGETMQGGKGIGVPSASSPVPNATTSPAHSASSGSSTGGHH
jgi:hypothetical protein